MKITIVGGGAHRLLGIFRAAFVASPNLAAGEINLYDRDARRSEALGRLLMKTPEFRRGGGKITWGTSLEEALDGADAVGAVLPAGPLRAALMSAAPCIENGFIDSDNVSPSGALCAARIAPVVMNLARKMESYCPSAWLVNFVNPVAVMSGMVNNHTRIKAMGVCQGYTNHLWDISRIFGKDEFAKGLDVETAGINHLSFIQRGTWNGRDLFAMLDERATDDWQMCKLLDRRPNAAKANIREGVTRLVKLWREQRVLVFSTEHDGMAHLDYEQSGEDARRNFRGSSKQQIDRIESRYLIARREADRTFESYLDRELPDEFWTNEDKTGGCFCRSSEDIFVRIFTAIAEDREMKVATSFPNRGAIAGVKDSHAVEYSQYVTRKDIRAADQYEIPNVVHGLTAALATHQAMLADALALEDPKLFAHALLAYPVRPYSHTARKMFKELLDINRPYLLSEPLKTAGQYL